MNGSCSCLPGWEGPLCAAACTEGFYGDQCSNTCQCENDATCDKANGMESMIIVKLCFLFLCGDDARWWFRLAVGACLQCRLVGGQSSAGPHGQSPMKGGLM